MKLFRNVVVAVGLMTSLGLSSQAFSFGHHLANAVYGVMEASARLVDHGLYAGAGLAGLGVGVAADVVDTGLNLASDVVDAGAFLGWQSMSLGYNTGVWTTNTALNLAQQGSLVAAGGLYYAARDLNYLMSAGFDTTSHAYTAAVNNFRSAYTTYQSYSYAGWDGSDDLNSYAQQFNW